MRDRSARVYRFVGWSRTSALLQKERRPARLGVRLLMRLLLPGVPETRPRTWRAIGPEGASSGGPFLLVTFLWESKEK